MLREETPASLLEIGSGSLGIGEFWRGSFVGVDLSFRGPRSPGLRAVRASAFALPFKDDAFDWSLCSDVLEHVDPGRREEVIRELLRVTRRRVILGFPSGAAARQSDARLQDWYVRHRLPVPDWLEEHLRFPFPDSSLVRRCVGPVEPIGNENLTTHRLLVCWESHPSRAVTAWAILLRRYLLPLAGWLLDRASYPPYYREIFVIQKPVTAPPS